MDYTYHNQLTLNSVLGNLPDAYALDAATIAEGVVLESGKEFTDWLVLSGGVK